MILLTRLDGHQILVNEALIVFAESTPDTVLTLAPGQRLLVKETLHELMERVAAQKALAAAGASHG